MTVLGIDPGSSSGSLTVLSKDASLGTTTLVVHNLPSEHKDMYGLLLLKDPTQVFVEDVGGTRPGNSAKSARTFAEHVGALKMALAVLPSQPVVTLVLPRKWMFELFGARYPSGSENLKARKQFILDEMKKTYPNCPITLRQADSVGIATWGLKQLETSKKAL